MKEAFTILIPKGSTNTIRLTRILSEKLKLSEDEIMVSYDGEYDW